MAKGAEARLGAAQTRPVTKKSREMNLQDCQLMGRRSNVYAGIVVNQVLKVDEVFAQINASICLHFKRAVRGSKAHDGAVASTISSCRRFRPGSLHNRTSPTAPAERPSARCVNPSIPR